MKKVFSSLIFFLILPIKHFRKVFRDNFLSGLILGAIFSLFVNVISMQLQGMIDKQRIFEAVEHEIVFNLMQSNNDATTALNQRKKRLNANGYITARKYSRDLWEQSTEPLQYISTLSSGQQIMLNVYYSTVVPAVNQMIETMNTDHIQFQSAKNCSNFNLKLSVDEQAICNEAYYAYLENVALYPGKIMNEESTKALKIFHPTQDRLNNPILRLLMGSESMRILSGK